MDSDSDCAFESADEEMSEVTRGPPGRSSFTNQIMSTSRQKKCGIDSDSDDDNEFVPTNVNTASWSTEISNVQKNQQDQNKNIPSDSKELDNKEINSEDVDKIEKTDVKNLVNDVKSVPARRQKPERQRKQKDQQKPAGLGAKKLGCKIISPPSTTPVEEKQEIPKNQEIIQECWEFDDEEATKILQKESQNDKGNLKWSKSTQDFDDDFPEELKSNKSFKEVFKPDRWDAIEDAKKEVEKKLIKPVEKRITTPTSPTSTTASTTPDENSSGGWGSWGSWGVNSLLNTASIGVSTISSHVSHGLSLLEETITAPETDTPTKTEEPEKKEIAEEEAKSNAEEENQTLGSSFGFGNLMYGVSSITKLVETTGNKVISGGLGTLETIGKKTMEVLQEGDPGLKKKRAFFMNEGDKPILSQMLREAKDKAEIEEKSVEGKEYARKVHFEILFDDYQGLVHLEALEMLSKQSNMKIQQKLVTLDSDDMSSVQETLEEVKELCDLGDEDEEDDETQQENLKEKLTNSCSDLGVDINYEKINEIWKETEVYIENVSKPDSTVSDLEIFENAISTLARFTAYSVERFHKTAELLLIKERRSTVNEADSLVQLTKILSGQIGIAASLFSKCLYERHEKLEKSSESIDITTIFLEATNASSYIQDAFRLLLPILQVGAL